MKRTSRLVLRKREREQRADRTRVLIVGAGAAAEALIRELVHTRYDAVGFVDDDKAKQGARIHGLTVLGTVEELRHVAFAYQVEELLIAMPSVSGTRMGRVIEHCLASGQKIQDHSQPGRSGRRPGNRRAAARREPRGIAGTRSGTP